MSVLDRERNAEFGVFGGCQIPERRRIFITIPDEPPIQDHTMVGQLAAMDEFIAAIKASDEEVPEFERVKFTRKVDL